MLYKLCVIVSAGLLLRGAAAQSVGDACREDGSRTALYSDCRSYLQCQQGKYVNVQCDSSLHFDSKLHKCIWSPLATCLENLEVIFEEKEAAKLTCDVEGSCSSNVGVKEDCHYYCPCAQNVVGSPTKCILNRYYDAVTDECREDDSVCSLVPTTPTPDTPCTNKNEKRVYPGDCKKYYQCINNKLQIENCGAFQYFNPTKLDCVTSVFSTPSYCKH